MRFLILFFIVFFLLWTPGLAQSKLDPYWSSYDAVEEPVTGDLILIDATAIYRVAGERMSRVAGGPPFSLLVSVSIESATGDIIVLDAAQAALFRIRGGQVTEIFSGGPLVRPIALDRNPTTGAFVVLDRGSRAVYEIGESGAVTVVSDRLDSAHPVDLIVDQVTGDYLLLDEEVGLFRFGSEGNWTPLSKLPSMGRATRLKQDSETGELLVIGSKPGELLRLDFRGEVLPSRREFALEGGQSPISLSHDEPGVGSLMDVDGNGTDDALTDGLLMLRRLFGFTGTTLTDGAIGPSAVRSTPDEVINYTDEVLHNIRIEPDPTSPNIIAGAKDNQVTAGMSGATISGGGIDGEGLGERNNVVINHHGTIGGGLSNVAGFHSTVAGGNGNRAGGIQSAVGGGAQNKANGSSSTVGGGIYNTAPGHYATVAGGERNSAEGRYASLAGGYQNSAKGASATVAGGSENAASGLAAAVAGGLNNTASGDYSFAAGRRAKANHDGAFVWADNINTDFSSTAVSQFLIRAQGGVGIGHNQPGNPLHVKALGTSSGGSAGFPAVVAHFEQADVNQHAALAIDGQVGRDAVVYLSSEGQSVWGLRNDASAGNAFQLRYHTEGANSTKLTVLENGRVGIGTTAPTGDVTIESNSGLTTALDLINSSTGDRSRHRFQIVGSGVAGREDNFEIWYTDALEGGSSNYNVLTSKPGSNSANIGFGRTNPSHPLHMASGAHVTSGGTWTNGSDRNSKENFTPVDSRAILQKVSELPLTTWNYRSEDDSIRRVGPMAQDFYAAFGLGGSDKTISTSDADGVALAAIQGLYELVQEQKEVIGQLQEKLQQLESLETQKRR